MKNYIYILFLILVGCSSSLNEPQLEFEEKIFVDGKLYAGEIIDSIRIYNTFPVFINPGEKSTFISEAKVIISCDGRENILKHIGNGFYSTTNLIAEKGKLYKLEIQVGKKKLFSSTKIPYDFDIGSVHIKKSDSQLYKNDYFVSISPNKLSAYFAIADGRNIIYEVKKSEDKNKMNNLTIQFYGDVNSNKSFETATVFAADLAFYNFFSTRINGKPEDDIFVSRGLNAKWNVKGDGIGMFIGFNKKTFSYKTINKN